MGDNQGRLVQLLDNIGHRKSLPRTGNAKQRLELVAFLEALDKGVYGLGLVTGGFVFTVKFKYILYSLHKYHLHKSKANKTFAL